jgi:hypothetical protein
MGTARSSCCFSAPLSQDSKAKLRTRANAMRHKKRAERLREQHEVVPETLLPDQRSDICSMRYNPKRYLVVNACDFTLRNCGKQEALSGGSGAVWRGALSGVDIVGVEYHKNALPQQNPHLLRLRSYTSPIEGVWGKSFPPAGSKGRALGHRRQHLSALMGNANCYA